MRQPAQQPGLVHHGPGLRRYLLLRTLRLPVVFALSIPVAFPVPTVATLMWLLIPLSGAIIDRCAPFGPAEEPAQAAGPNG